MESSKAKSDSFGLLCLFFGLIFLHLLICFAGHGLSVQSPSFVQIDLTFSDVVFQFLVFFAARLAYEISAEEVLNENHIADQHDIDEYLQVYVHSAIVLCDVMHPLGCFVISQVFSEVGRYLSLGRSNILFHV